MDEAVKRAQTWLNDTYNGKKGYSTITDDGIIDAGTIKALIIALQIEEGDSNPDGIFGKNTAGRPGRQLAKGLIYALQAEQGLAVGSADGLFGPATQKKCPTLSAGDTRQGYIKIMKYALYLNGIDVASFSGTFGADTTEDVRSFQTFASLPVAKYGVVDPMTWASLLTIKGDTSRGTQACDTSKVLTANRLAILKSKNYRIFGRYLTGKYAMSVDEIERILGANANVENEENKNCLFPIFQRTGGVHASNTIEYFTETQGLEEGKEAVEAALKLGFKEKTIIFFASDVDAYDYQVKSILLPYYKKVKEAFDANKRRNYIMGIYGPRNTCIQVCDAGYASACFVSDMSTAYSGNLGYPLPKLWAFDQYAGDAFGNKGDADYVDIDKDAVSGSYLGETEISPYNPLSPYDNAKLEEAIRIAVAITVKFETGYTPDNPEAYSALAGNYDGAGMSFGLIQFNFGQETLQPILNDMIKNASDDMSEIFGNDYDKLKEVLQGSKDSMVAWADSISSDGNTTLNPPWKDHFVQLGQHPVCQELQRKYLVDIYLNRAINTICESYELKTYRGVAMAFDVAVNIWGFGDKATEIKAQFTPDMPEQEKLKIMARYGAESSKPRREAIANGTGIVYDPDNPVDLDNDFGLSNKFFR
ncbi:MAG: DUF1906 domain-containing protein [Lachnospiraceae bacterium]|nr:DUF1906 domain-containing protein [Lachnospiraceae bacterium]